ncbi:MAG: hypothetical protein PHV05_02960 [Candidatus Riflebacteria bacterium]|nr:hypothetical protein [Candidatus Riflebacteria bacterium]
MQLLLAGYASAEFVPFSGSDEVNSIVVTFDPPIISNVNRSADFFKLLLDTMKDNNTRIAEEIDKAGAIWTSSQNLSGIQFSLYYPENPRHAVELTQKLLSNLSEKIPSFLFTSSQPVFSDYLHALCRIGESPAYYSHKPVSINLIGKVKSFSDELQNELPKFDTLYGLPKPSFQTQKSVFAKTFPTMVEIFSWNQLTAETFFSAKFTGEYFLKELGQESGAAYEILFDHSAVSLVLLASGTEEQLFKASDKIKDFARLQTVKTNKPAWESFVTRATSILQDDLRDLGKAALFNAWAKHWQGNFFPISSDMAYVPPVSHSSSLNMPEPWMHQFSFSNKTMPRVIACSISASSEVADIAITINSESTIINEIVTCLEEKSSLNFPLTIEKHDPGSITMVFHCKKEEISGNIARIRARIINYLVDKNMLGNLAPLTVGIAGICDIPPFELRGLLENGWPGDIAEHAWKQASASDVSRILAFGNADAESFKRRWQIISSTSRGKAIILSMIGAADFCLKNFTEL